METKTTTACTLTECQLTSWKAYLTAHSQVNRLCDERMRESGQIPIEVYDVLVNLEVSDGWRLRMSELAEKVLLSRSGLTRLVDRIEKQGWIKREGCPDDRRGSFALLTPEGQAVRESAWAVLRPLLAETWGCVVQETECSELTDLFNRVSERVQSLRSMPER